MIHYSSWVLKHVSKHNKYKQECVHETLMLQKQQSPQLANFGTKVTVKVTTSSTLVSYERLLLQECACQIWRICCWKYHSTEHAQNASVALHLKKKISYMKPIISEIWTLSYMPSDGRRTLSYEPHPEPRSFEKLFIVNWMNAKCI